MSRTHRNANHEPPPSTFEAQLATLVKAPPQGGEWLHELKYDGYRIGCAIDGSNVRLLSRNGNDWTARFPSVAAAALKLGARSALLDGEVTVVLADGRTSFQALQNAGAGGGGGEMVYFVFDLLHLDGEKVASLPLEERKERLRALLKRSDRSLRYSDHIVGRGDEMFASACAAGAEGIVSKRRDEPYRPGRSKGWLKTKCSKRQELVIGGFTEPQGARSGLGALLVGVHEGGHLLYSGKVGTGFSQKMAADLRQRLDQLEVDTCPFEPRPRAGVAAAHWVRPKLVAEVEFTEWTADGKIRHPSFQGLREDKEAKKVTRERATDVATPAAARPLRRPRTRASAATEAEVAGVRITHPDRVVYPEAGLTKREVAEFYAEIADHILPHLADRPLTLVRCPEGVGSECFYMKHAGAWRSKALRRVSIREKTKTGDYLIAESVAGLVTLVQMGVLEFHTWNSTAKHLENPDRVVLDLDPGPELKWPAVVAAAQLVRARLEELSLESFVKTTGGRGLHVVVPLNPRTDWETGLAFSRALAETIVRSDPETYTIAFAKAGRERKILIDYKRNDRGSTSVAAFSTRARASAPVSIPLVWGELSSRRPSDYYTVARLRRSGDVLRADAWKGYASTRQRISASVVRELESRSKK